MKVCTESAETCLKPILARGLCSTHYARAAYRADPERGRAKRRRWFANKLDFGITVAQYDAMLVAQGGCCRLCKSTTPGQKRKVHFMVDHCHTTGKIRGLLCHPCNVALGLFKDNITTLKEAQRYLEQNGDTGSK